MAVESRRVPMTNVDKAWLEMDSATNLMIINGVMLFEEQLDFEVLKQSLADRFVAKYERFRQHVVTGQGGRLYWEDDPNFDIRAHVRRYALPHPANIATLQTVVSAVINEPLDRSKPLWRFLLIENAAGGSAIIARMHHCIGDGIALIKVLIDMTGPTPEESLTLLPVAPPNRPNALFGPLPAFVSFAIEAVKNSAKLAQTVASQTFQTIENPKHPFDIVKSAGIISVASAAILAKLIILPPDRNSVFKGKLGAIKRVVWSDPIELERVKKIGKALDATINDVLVAAIAGTLRKYMIQAGDDPAHGDITAMVPVNLRSANDKRQLGNAFALVFLSLPVSLSDPYDRLMATKRHMDVLKNSPEPFLVYQILGAIGAMPLDLAVQATTWFSTKASAVLTNVPGPRQQLYFAGQPLQNLIFWVPQSGEIGLGISIFSYRGMVTLGLMIDERLVSDLQLIMDGYEEELVLLEERVAAAAKTGGNGTASAVNMHQSTASAASNP